MRHTPAAVALLALLCGCGTQIVWVEEDVLPSFDHTFIKKIAVVEFENRTRDRGAGRAVSDRVEELLVSESPYEVVTRMDLDRIVQEHKLSLEGLLDSDTMKDLGRLAGVDALVVGSVEGYELEETPIKPPKVARRASVSIVVKGVNAVTGCVFFSANPEGTSFWRGWTDTDAAVSPRQCMRNALDEAMCELRGLFPHKKKVRVLSHESGGYVE